MNDYLEKKREIEAHPDSIRILHLEDDPRDEEIIRSTLESEGIACQIVCARTGRDFLKALELHTFDLILADNLLPDFGGMDALKMVQELCPQVPFIFVTGTMGEEFAVETLKLGAKDYVLKDRLFRLVPSVRRALREVREHKNRRRVEDELQKLFLAVEQSGSLVSITDSSGKIEFANPKFLQVSGYPLEEVAGKTPDFFRSPDSGSDVWESPLGENPSG